MIPVFAFFNGDIDALRATGIAAHGSRWEAYPMDGTLAVVVIAHHPHARIAIDQLHDALVVFPGPNGKLSKRHVQHIAKAFPAAKEGDAFSTVLSAVHSKYGSEAFNPDAY